MASLEAFWILETSRHKGFTILAGVMDPGQEGVGLLLCNRDREECAWNSGHTLEYLLGISVSHSDCEWTRAVTPTCGRYCCQEFRPVRDEGLGHDTRSMTKTWRGWRQLLPAVTPRLTALMMLVVCLINFLILILPLGQEGHWSLREAAPRTCTEKWIYLARGAESSSPQVCSQLSSRLSFTRRAVTGQPPVAGALGSSFSF